MPEPILIAIAAALAGKTAGSLYDLVKKKFSGHPEAQATLTAAAGATPDSAEVQALSEELQHAMDADDAFANSLLAAWHEQHADHGGMTNSVTGNVTGTVVQARDIHGGVNFGRSQ